MNAIKHNSNEPLWDEIYKNNYNFFRKYFEVKFFCSKADIEDYYQEAFIIFLENVQRDDFNVPSNMIKWYLIKTARYKLLNKYRRSQLMRQMQEEQPYYNGEEGQEQQAAFVGNQEVREQAITYLFSKLDATAKRLIDLRYLKQYCHEAVAREMNYQSAAVSKSQLSRILKKIRGDEEFLAKLRLMLY